MVDQINPYAAPPSLDTDDMPRPLPWKRDVMHHAWVLFTGNLGVILAVVTAVCLPLELLRSYMDYFVIDPEDFQGSLKLTVLLDSSIMIIAIAAVISIGVRATSNEIPTFRGALATAFHSWFAFWWTRMLSGLLIAVGLLLLVFPGIYLAVRMSLADSVVIVEQTAGTSAIRRSFTLTRGRFWLMLRVCIAVSILLVVLVLFSVIPSVFFPILDHWVIAALTAVVFDFGTAYFALCFYCAYLQLAETGLHRHECE